MFIELGIVSKPHGFRGELVAARCEGQESALGKIPKIYFSPSLDAPPFTILEAAWMPKGWKLKLEGVTSVADVEKLKGKPIYARREDLPELEGDEFYVGELTNATAVDAETGKTLGTFIGVEPLVAGSVDRWWFKIDGQDVAVPSTRRFIAKVDPDKRQIHLSHLDELKEG